MKRLFSSNLYATVLGVSLGTYSAANDTTTLSSASESIASLALSNLTFTDIGDAMVSVELTVIDSSLSLCSSGELSSSTALSITSPYEKYPLRAEPSNFGVFDSQSERTVNQAKAAHQIYEIVTSFTATIEAMPQPYFISDKGVFKRSLKAQEDLKIHAEVWLFPCEMQSFADALKSKTAIFLKSQPIDFKYVGMRFFSY